MKIVVIGGTGRIGGQLVAALREQHHDAVPAGLETGVNVISGAGLPRALHGASVVVDATDAPSYESDAALEFFQTSTRNLLDAEQTANVAHHVVFSVVGTDRLNESGYFRAKLAQEHLVDRSTVPHTTVRATQFFEFVERLADRFTVGDVVRVPPAFVQPAAIGDVARALAAIAVGEPNDRIIEIGGPELFRLDDLIELVLESRRDGRAVIADPRVRYFGAALEDRTLLPGTNAQLTATRLHDWLDQHAREGVTAPTITGPGTARP